MSTRQFPRSEPTQTKTSDLNKYVYIISHPNHSKANLYKVGVAKNLTSRLNRPQADDPLRDYKVAFFLLTPYFRETQRHVHELFACDHEWVIGQLEEIIKAIEEYPASPIRTSPKK